MLHTQVNVRGNWCNLEVTEDKSWILNIKKCNTYTVRYLLMGCSSSFSACTAAAAHWFYDFVFIKTLSPLCFYALGSEEGAVFPPLPRGVPAPCRVCLHGGHVALPLRLHHYLHCAPQVRGDFTLNCSFRTMEARVQAKVETSPVCHCVAGASGDTFWPALLL